MELKERQQLRQEDTWDLTTIFASDNAWEQEYESLEVLIPQVETFKGTLTQSPEQLLKVLQFRDDIFMRIEKLYVYTSLNKDTDTQNPYYQGLNSRAMTLYTKLSAAFSFYHAELMAAPEEEIRSYLNTFEALTMYSHEFDELFAARAHILSEPEQRIISKSMEALGATTNIFSMINNADIDFPMIIGENGKEVQLSHGLYGKLLENADRKIRENAFKGTYSTYMKLKNTLAATLTGNIKKDNFLADVHMFESARAKALFNNVIPETVYDALVEAVNDRLPLLHRYVSLRKKALNLAEIRMYDLHVPMVEDIDLTFTFTDAKQLVLDGLKVLGPEYQSILEKAFNNRWIDHIENKGKRSGAYSSGTYETNPYILMNWQDTLDNAFTLAHELGHSVHSYYTRKHQPYVYGNYSIFLAEVASTTNELLLTDYLLKKYDDPKIQAYIINHYLDGIRATLYRQTQFAEFEHLIHTADQSGIALTAEYLTTEYFKLNQKYYGSEMQYDEEIGYEWSRIPHFYYNYYVYQYATGISAASILSQKILVEGQPAIDAYINYLKSGCSDYPINVLKKAGIDMTSNQATVDALATFEQRLDELEAILAHK